MDILTGTERTKARTLKSQASSKLEKFNNARLQGYLILKSKGRRNAPVLGKYKRKIDYPSVNT